MNAVKCSYIMNCGFFQTRIQFGHVSTITTLY